MRASIKKALTVVLALVILSGCQQEQYEGWDGKPIPSYEPEKLPLTELDIYQENYTPSGVTVDSEEYYASRAGLCTGEDFSGCAPLCGEFTPTRSEYGWVLESNLIVRHEIRNFITWCGKSVVQMNWFYGMCLNNNACYNVYLVELDFPYNIEPAPDNVVSYAFVVEESDGSTDLIEPEPIAFDGSTAILLGYGFIE